jgi:tryptophanyl-tRNA synthetase
MQRLMAEPGEIDAVLRDGGERARALSGPVLAEVFETVGFLRD